MSNLNDVISKAVDEVKNVFSERVSKKFNLNKDDVLKCLSNSCNKVCERICEKKEDKKVRLEGSSIPRARLSPEGERAEVKSEVLTDLNKKTATKLKAICKQYGLKQSGKKADLVERIEQYKLVGDSPKETNVSNIKSNVSNKKA